MAASGLLPVGWETLTALGGRMLAGRWYSLVCSLEHALGNGFGRGAQATRNARTACWWW